MDLLFVWCYFGQFGELDPIFFFEFGRLEDICKGFGNVGKTLNEFPIESSEAQKGSDVSYCLGYGPALDCCHFGWVSVDLIFFHSESQELYFGAEKVAFATFGEQLFFAEDGEDLSDVLQVFFLVFAVDEDVVQVTED